LKTFDFRHSAAAHFYRSRGTLVCRGTQVGKHCFRPLHVVCSSWTVDLQLALLFLQSMVLFITQNWIYSNVPVWFGFH